MRQPFVLLSILILTLSAVSCKKSNPGNAVNTIDTASIIGTWNWVFQTRNDWYDTTTQSNLTPATTGVSRTLIFDSAGTFTFIHNDSIFQDTSSSIDPNYLVIPQSFQLLPAMTAETDTGFYQVTIGIVGCVFQDTTLLQMNNITYQALISADTLLVHQDPCLSRVADIYVRKN